MYWCHVGVYVDNVTVFEFLFQLTTHSKGNTSVSLTKIIAEKKDAPNKVTVLSPRKP